MSRNRTGDRLIKYSLSPVRYVRRVISTSANATGRRPSELSNSTETSAKPSGLRESLPAKITSSNLPPRKLLLDVSPSDQRNASTKFDLPEPFGPTMAVMPGENVSVVGSANVLNPNILTCLSFMCAVLSLQAHRLRRRAVRPSSTSHCRFPTPCLPRSRSTRTRESAEFRRRLRYTWA